MSGEPSITCPRCGRTSYHPTDIQEGYCGACHDWTSPRADQTPPSHDVEIQPYRHALAAEVRRLAVEAEIPLAIVAPELADADRLESEYGDGP